MTVCSKVARDMLRKLNHFSYQACEPNGFTFIDNKIKTYGMMVSIYILVSSKIIIADNLIHNINHFLQITNQFIWNS